MKAKGFPTVTDQVTERLRQGMVEGHWRDTLPGRKRLAEEMGCSPWTVEEAVERLAREGLLVSQGAGRRRRIALREGAVKPRALRLKILLYEASDRKANYMVDLLHRLQVAGHETAFAEETMRDLVMNVERIARFANRTKTDACVVMAG